jgi:esterase/lipase
MKTQTLEIGRSDAKLRIVIFHGYTVSPDEFRELAEAVIRRFDAHVLVPLLPGHGTQESDILGISFDDLLRAAEDVVEEEQKKGDSLVLMGNSFGGYLALLTAQKCRPHAIVLSAMPFSLQLRFDLPWMPLLMRTRTFWNKELTAQELEMRKELFYYPRMPGIALTLIKQGIRRVKKILPTILCPILTIYNSYDPIVRSISGEHILARSGHNPLNKSIIFSHDQHGLYYGPHKEDVVASIISFLTDIRGAPYEAERTL